MCLNFSSPGLLSNGGNGGNRAKQWANSPRLKWLEMAPLVVRFSSQANTQVLLSQVVAVALVLEGAILLM